MKRIFGLLSLFIILIIGIFILSPRKTIIKTETKNYKVYIEEDGDYVLSDSNKISSKGYVLNTSQSSCTNGSTISQDSNTGVVSVTTSKQDNCNFYFQRASELTLNKLHLLNNDIELKQVSGYPKLNLESPKAIGSYDAGFARDEKTTSIADSSKYITYSTTYTIEDNKYFKLVNPQICVWSSCYTTFASGTYYTSQNNLRDSSSPYSPSSTAIYQISNNSSLSELKYYQNIGMKTGKFSYSGNFSSTESSTNANVNNYVTCSETYTFSENGGIFILDNPHACKWSDVYNALVQDPTRTFYTCHPYVQSSTTIYNPTATTMYKISPNSTSNKMYYANTIGRDLIEYDEDDVGLFSLDDNYGKSYFFRGKITNNYVKFGKNSNNENMFWSILRINGDGSLRLIYNAASVNSWYSDYDDQSIGQSKYNTTETDATHVGYMYANFSGSTTSYEQAIQNDVSSTLKTYLESWYTTNIENTGYSNYVSDEIFCNDRSLRSGNGYGLSVTNYNGTYRSLPIYLCNQKHDSFTVSDNFNGNGKLSKPIGTITRDEVLAAGKSSYDFLKRTVGTNVWTMTPGSVNSSGWVNVSNGIVGSGSNSRVSANRSVVPVINIKREYVNSLQGNGTKNNPFYIGT